jgi:hypothetical protein
MSEIGMLQEIIVGVATTAVATLVLSYLKTQNFFSEISMKYDRNGTTEKSGCFETSL